MKALASDIDGTLVFNQQIKKQDREAIEKYQKEHLFGVCSGRPRCALFDLKQLKLDFYILSSGAVILDKDLNIIQDFPMKKEIVQQIFNEHHQHAQIILQTGNADVFYATLKEDYNPKLKVISSFKEVEHEIIYGISLIFKDDKTTKKVRFKINQKYHEVEGFQNRNSVDIVRKGCSKGTGIKIIKDHYQLEKMAGIGDSYNDLPMLKVVDTAFTFKTSPQEIQKQVNYCVNDIAEAIPCYICILAMPFFYSISEGISMGVISYVILNLMTGKAKEKKISALMYVLAVLFILKYVFL